MKQGTFLVRYALQSFGIILVLAVLIRTFLISSYVMSGWSMLPNIWPGDFLLGDKITKTRLQRGDVVVLRCPNAKDQICMKRVVGLPGDRIEFRNHELIINGEKSRHKEVKEGVELESVLGARWLIWPLTKGKEPLDAEPLVVPPHELYLLNDKRSFLEDSRTWGTVKIDQLDAKVWRVWLSLDWYDGDVVRSMPRIRWSRMLRSID
jgi:signal peptidase I